MFNQDLSLTRKMPLQAQIKLIHSNIQTLSEEGQNYSSEVCIEPEGHQTESKPHCNRMELYH